MNTKRVSGFIYHIETHSIRKPSTLLYKGHLVPKVLEKALVCRRLDVLGPGLPFTLEGVPF